MKRAIPLTLSAIATFLTVSGAAGYTVNHLKVTEARLTCKTLEQYKNLKNENLNSKRLTQFIADTEACIDSTEGIPFLSNAQKDFIKKQKEAVSLSRSALPLMAMAEGLKEGMKNTPPVQAAPAPVQAAPAPAPVESDGFMGYASTGEPVYFVNGGAGRVVYTIGNDTVTSGVACMSGYFSQVHSNGQFVTSKMYPSSSALQKVLNLACN
ncbi:hypothetical protein HC928_02915 [bacterium]|nr:hypothetical protein [bacterium]